MHDESQQSLNPRRDARQRQWLEFRTWVYLTAHGALYWTLFKLGLGWKFSAWLCSMSRYRFFVDGRCMYCGIKHKKEQT